MRLPSIFYSLSIHLISDFLDLNPLTPMSDQDRISPYYYLYNIIQTSDENKEKYMDIQQN